MSQPMYSLIDSLFTPTRILVVSEERLKEAEIKAKREQIKVVEKRIIDLQKYMMSLEEDLYTLDPPAKERPDLAPCSVEDNN